MPKITTPESVASKHSSMNSPQGAKTNLIHISQWAEPTLTVADEGDRMTFHIQDALNYHGYDAVGGVVLGFRLLQKAISLFAPAPGELIQRRQVTLFTAFPGLGARDCFELITRMVSCQNIQVDTSFSNTIAPEGVQGRFFFQFGYGDKSAQLAPIEGYPGADFIALGKASKLPNFTPEQQQAWRNAKFQLANTLLGAHYNEVIRVL